MKEVTLFNQIMQRMKLALTPCQKQEKRLSVAGITLKSNKINPAQSSLKGPRLCLQSSALCLYFNVLFYSGHFWVGSGCVSPSKRQRAGEVRVDKT